VIIGDENLNCHVSKGPEPKFACRRRAPL
jgi:hypothetical protein